LLGHSIDSQHFMEPKGSILNSEELSTCPYPEPDQSSPHHPVPALNNQSESLVRISSLGSFIQGIRPSPRLLCLFYKKLIFYGKGLLAPRPTSKLEAHSLSFVRCCLFNIFAATLHSCRPFLHPQPEDASCHGDREPPNMALLQLLL
jgi:hypothetical protein